MPAVWQQFVDAAGRLCRQPLEHIAQVGVRIDAVHLRRADQAHDRRGALAGAQTAGEQPVVAPERDRPDPVLDPVVVGRQVAIAEVARERRPALQAVIDRSGGGRAVLLVAALGTAKLASPAFEQWADGRDMAFGGLVVGVIAISFVAAALMARLRPRPA